MRNVTTELSVGLFMIMGFLAFVYLSLQLGEFSVFALEKNYPINAEFDNVSGLKAGATVEIAGVTVGKVSAISLGEHDMAKVTMLISRDVPINDNAIASIRTQGLIGDKYIRIVQDGSGERLPDNATILETESAVDLEALISKYIFGKI